jgi:hypothetical protein
MHHYLTDSVSKRSSARKKFFSQHEPAKAARVLSQAIHTHGYSHAGVWASAAHMMLTRLPDKARSAASCSAASRLVAESMLYGPSFFAWYSLDKVQRLGHQLPLTLVSLPTIHISAHSIFHFFFHLHHPRRIRHRLQRESRYSCHARP